MLRCGLKPKFIFLRINAGLLYVPSGSKVFLPKKTRNFSLSGLSHVVIHFQYEGLSGNESGGARAGRSSWETVNGELGAPEALC